MTKIKVRYLGDLGTEMTHEDSGAKIITDAPKDIGGEGKAFSPTDLFAASLVSCILTIMAMHAKKLGFDMEGAEGSVEKEMAGSPKRRVGKLIIRIRSPHLPSPQIREKLEAFALNCPVHLSIHSDVVQEIDFVWGL